MPVRGVYGASLRAVGQLAEDAVIDDRARGRYARPTDPAINHKGRTLSGGRAAEPAAHPAGPAVWCRRDRPTPAAASRRGTRSGVPPPIWRGDGAGVLCDLRRWWPPRGGGADKY